MPEMAMSLAAYRRLKGNFVEFPLINFFPEQTPTDAKGVALQSRMGLETHVTRGDGPIDGIFAAPGSVAGDLITISDNVFYVDGVSKGSITGSGPVSWAASDTEVVVTRGLSAYSYNGTDLQVISFPDAANVLAVAYIASLFVFVRADTHKFYWSAILDARTIDGLDFASAELMPDNLLDAKAMRGVLYLIGEESTEPWFPSGNVDLPFTRIDQRLFSIGTKATGCTVELDNALVTVGHDGPVYRMGDGPEQISDHGIEERIAASATVSAFGYPYEGHKHYCIRLDDCTLAYDFATKSWWEVASYNHPNWRAQCATNIGGTPYFGDDTTNDVWKFGTVFLDDGDPLEGYFTAAASITGGAVPMDVIEVRANVGHTQPLSGDDASPVLEMKTSGDGGNTFGSWRETSLGEQGKYRTRPSFRRCGTFSSPGVVCRFRVTDQSPRRISGVYYNEEGGGRSRG